MCKFITFAPDEYLFMTQKTAIIIGAGPAGLTAAYELLERTDIIPIVIEASEDIGGISKTVNYKGNHIDLGGHRFFSKSDRVMDWWLKILPMQVSGSNPAANAPDPENTDKVMLYRNRLSRIYFLRKFFDYPVTLNLNTIKGLGFIRIFKISISYLYSRLFPVKTEKSLEDFFSNRFGKELYKTFFRDYTEKVWGIHCSQISPEWGAQRIKGLSVSKAVGQAIKNIFSSSKSIRQKEIETTLIQQYLYPKFGPGQLWTEVTDSIKEKGGQILMSHKAVGFTYIGNTIQSVKIINEKTSEVLIKNADYFFSTMPVKDLVESLGSQVTEDVKKVAQGLVYRDFITVGLLLNKLKIQNLTKIKTHNNLIPDNWIYIQESDVKLGRLQIFNNWSPYMVSDKNKVWIGLEYFCNEGDELWSMTDEKFSTFAMDELAKIDIIDKADVLDHVVIRMPKTYPAYFGTYNQFDSIRTYIDKFENLFLTGRNGMHRYNNQDHSMLTAMTAVDNIINGIKTKDNIWAVNTEEEYHEEKK